MKIILANDYKTVIGGTEIYLWSLKKALEKNGHEVVVFGSSKSYDEYIYSQKVKSIERYTKKLFNIQTYLDFKKLVNEFKPDIIHVHNFYNELSPSILLVTGKIPIVMTVHDTLLVNAVSVLSGRTGEDCKTRTCSGCTNCVGFKGMIYEKLRKIIYRTLLKRISLFITPSIYLNNFLVEAGFQPIQTVYNGINLFKFSKVNNFDRLLYVGRMSRDKGVEYLLKAMPDIIKQFPKVKLILLGDGPDKDYFINLSKKLDIINNLNFLGSVNKEEIKKQFDECSIVIVPSVFSEAFGLVVVESMSVGRPVIGTTSGALPELIENDKTGYIIPSKNSHILAEKVIKLLSNKNLIANMSKISKIKSMKYSIESHVIEITNIYKKFIK